MKRITQELWERFDIDVDVEKKSVQLIRDAVELVSTNDDRLFVAAMICSMMQRAYFRGKIAGIQQASQSFRDMYSKEPK